MCTEASKTLAKYCFPLLIRSSVSQQKCDKILIESKYQCRCTSNFNVFSSLGDYMPFTVLLKSFENDLGQSCSLHNKRFQDS